jgi:hypothetical protein
LPAFFSSGNRADRDFRTPGRLCHRPPTAAVDVARSNVRRIACLRFNAPDGLRQQKGRILRFAAAPVRSWCPNKRRTARASPVRSDEPRMPRSGCLQNPSQHQSGRRRYLPFRAAHTIQSQPFILPFNIEASKEYPWLKTISGVQCTFRYRRFQSQKPMGIKRIA